MFLKSVMEDDKMIIVLCITFNIILVSGSSLSDKVQQTPADIYKNPGEKAKINCLHKIDNYYTFLWYKQLKNRQLQFLGYMYKDNGNPEKGLNVSMDGSADKGQTSTLTIEGLSLNDSAVYFCAASSSLSDQVHQIPADIQKKPGGTAKIYCSHSIDSYDRILWYKQLKNKQLQFLGYMLGKDGYPEKGVDVKIEGDANKGQNCTLTIEGLSLSSSAVYFCGSISLHHMLVLMLEEEDII
ncbi:uncharacterized protein LOC127142195 [Lates calcarifer]|uniref:Uncharacterized protein LOC127142195 n=1 Tax=Lates calcarifer TaxID=8187 RepID=A0AAJ8B4T1_LATCA|nr:uncharacterized protein LOC127142195 [Lates calcarifer]